MLVIHSLFNDLNMYNILFFFHKYFNLTIYLCVSVTQSLSTHSNPKYMDSLLKIKKKGRTEIEKIFN